MAEKNKKKKQQNDNIREVFQHEFVGADTGGFCISPRKGIFQWRRK